MTDFSTLRERMVARRVMARGITDPALIAALRAVPREMFVAPAFVHAAYDDCALPIDAGQTISQPYIVALMIHAAGIGRDDHVLEVGAGSGYAAAVLGQLARDVVAIERHAVLAASAAERIARLGYGNVRIVAGDGVGGWPEGAPFDAILVPAGAPHVPPALLDQLKPDGRLIMPVGTRLVGQSLVRLGRGADGRVSRDTLCAVRFVPLVGAQ
jgi:protein-L-isoaspartate(D-aspartate) O-methyltransferase